MLLNGEPTNPLQQQQLDVLREWIGEDDQEREQVEQRYLEVKRQNQEWEAKFQVLQAQLALQKEQQESLQAEAMKYGEKRLELESEQQSLKSQLDQTVQAREDDQRELESLRQQVLQLQELQGSIRMDGIKLPESNGQDGPKEQDQVSVSTASTSPSAKGQKSPVDVSALQTQALKSEYKYANMKAQFDQTMVQKLKADHDAVESMAKYTAMKAHADCLEKQADDATHEKAKFDADFVAQRKELRETKLKHKLLKVHFEDEMEHKKRSEKEITTQTQRASDMKQKYDLMKGQFDDESSRKLKAESDYQQLKVRFDQKSAADTAEIDQLKSKATAQKSDYDGLMAQKLQADESSIRFKAQADSAIEAKAKVDDDLLLSAKMLEGLQSKHRQLKTDYDDEMVFKQRAEQSRISMKHKYDSMKEKFDSEEKMKLRAEEELVVQREHAKEATQLYSTMKGHFDKKQELATRQEEMLSQQSSHIKVLEWMLQKPSDEASAPPEEIPERPLFSCPLQSLEYSERSTEFTTGANDTRPDGKEEGDNQVANDANPADPETFGGLDDHSSLTNISHDMRTPLTTAVSALDILMDEKVCLSEADRMELLQKTWSALQTVLILVNNILDYSKLRTAGMHPVPKRVNIRRLAIQALRNMEIQAKLVRVEFILDVDADVPMSIYCDRILLQRIFVNLLANALKFSPSTKGRILFHLGWDAEREFLQASVTDNGRGMSETEQAALFRPFFQGSHAKGGSGLGLTICQQLVTGVVILNAVIFRVLDQKSFWFSTEMGGTISAHSEGPDQGSVFQFEIHTPPANNVRSVVAEPVLVFEEDPIRRKAIFSMFEYAGVSAFDGCRYNPWSESSATSPASLPAVIFVSACHPTANELVHEWKGERNLPVCLMIPNHFALNPAEVSSRTDSILHSPIDMAELRGVMRTYVMCGQSETSSCLSRQNTSNNISSSNSACSNLNNPHPHHHHNNKSPTTNDENTVEDKIHILLVVSFFFNF